LTHRPPAQIGCHMRVPAASGTKNAKEGGIGQARLFPTQPVKARACTPIRILNRFMQLALLLQPQTRGWRTAHQKGGYISVQPECSPKPVRNMFSDWLSTFNILQCVGLLLFFRPAVFFENSDFLHGSKARECLFERPVAWSVVALTSELGSCTKVLDIIARLDFRRPIPGLSYSHPPENNFSVATRKKKRSLLGSQAIDCLSSAAIATCFQNLVSKRHLGQRIQSTNHCQHEWRFNNIIHTICPSSFLSIIHARPKGTHS